MPPQERIYLSSPHLSGREQTFVADAFATNWIAPLGPHVDAFEREFADVVGAPHAVALSSGTAALHLALQLAGVGRDDEVMVSTFTFAASVNPIVYLGARPVLVDSERTSWNMDPALLAEALRDRTRRGSRPKAVVVVHIYGQSADLDPIQAACEASGVPLVEDAAEALGATYYDRTPGTIGLSGAYSFNGNKIITTSGGGMLVTHDGALAARARHLATQARDAAPHYEHSEIGYNYRLSNVLAAIGRGQLPALEDRVAARRRNFECYVEALRDLPGIGFMPEAPWGRHTRWNSVITIDRDECGVDPEHLRVALAARNIESRPVWKPMHRQPVFADCASIGGSVADDLFARGLCLPSGSNLAASNLEQVVDAVRTTVRHSQRGGGRLRRTHSQPGMIADFIAPGDSRWRRVLERARHDVYHLPEYARFSARHEGGTPCAFFAESKGRELLIPLLIRPLPDDIGAPTGWKDATSPYGYPGPIATAPFDGDWIQQSLRTFQGLAREDRILTAFLRLHPLRGIPHDAMSARGSTVHHGDVVYVDLARSSADIWADMCTNHRRNIRRMVEAGFSEAIDDWSAYPSFGALYRETMDRVKASSFYFFSDAYFRDLREMLPGQLHISTVRAPHGEIAAAGLFTHTDAIVEYHLSGTAAAFRHHAPSKLMLDVVRRWAATMGATLMNFGGGTGGEVNSLFEFKAGFGRGRAPFHTVRMVFDAPLYAALAGDRSERNGSLHSHSGFFPSYREPQVVSDHV